MQASVGAGLPAIAVVQSIHELTAPRYRGQARSHIWIGVHIGSVVFEVQAPGSASCGLTKSNAAN